MKSKAKNIIVYTISAIILGIAIFIMIGSIIAKRDNKTFQIFGISFHIVVSESMEPEIKVGDFLISKKTDIEDIKIGDDVLFYSKNPALAGKLIVHRVVKIDNIGNEIQLTTKGINNTKEDRYKVTEIVGRKVYVSSTIGKYVNGLTSPLGIFLLIVIIIAVFILISQVRKIIIYCKENKRKVI